MPFKDPDPNDPNMFVGVVVPADAEATREMAYVFAEEFARMGYTREQLIWLFKNPHYGGAHGAYQQLGEKETLGIIDESVAAWGRLRVVINDTCEGTKPDDTHSSFIPHPSSFNEEESDDE